MKSVLAGCSWLHVLTFAIAVWGCGCSVDTSGLGGPKAVHDGGGMFDIRPGEGSGSGGKSGSGGATGVGGRGAGGGIAASGGAASGTGGAPSQGSGGMPPGTGGIGVGGSGAQPVACGPSSCPDGCCNGNLCVTANRTAQLCGMGGLACAPCESCFRCVGGACRVDPQSDWSVVCGDATVLPLDGTRLWDPIDLTGSLLLGGVLPDPFCELRLDGRALARTSVDSDTVTPTWNQPISPTGPADPALTAADLMSPDTHWSVFVGDDDGDASAFNSICEVAPSPTDADFAAGTMTFDNQQSCVSLRLQLSCNE